MPRKEAKDIEVAEFERVGSLLIHYGTRLNQLAESLHGHGMRSVKTTNWPTLHRAMGYLGGAISAATAATDEAIARQSNVTPGEIARDTAKKVRRAKRGGHAP